MVDSITPVNRKGSWGLELVRNPMKVTKLSGRVAPLIPTIQGPPLRHPQSYVRLNTSKRALNLHFFTWTVPLMHGPYAQLPKTAPGTQSWLPLPSNPMESICSSFLRPNPHPPALSLPHSRSLPFVTTLLQSSPNRSQPCNLLCMLFQEWSLQNTARVLPPYFSVKTLGGFLMITLRTRQTFLIQHKMCSWRTLTLSASFTTPPSPTPKSDPPAHCSSSGTLCSRHLCFWPCSSRCLAHFSLVLLVCQIRFYLHLCSDVTYSSVSRKSSLTFTPGQVSCPPPYELPQSTHHTVPMTSASDEVTWEQKPDEPPSQCLAQSRHIIKSMLFLLYQTPSNII